MERLLFLIETFEPFTSEWGAVCIPISHKHEETNGFALPLGWEEELTERGIKFTEIEIEQLTNQVDEELELP
jgi:hypothetical protein